jgi:hypothetical protein
MSGAATADPPGSAADSAEAVFAQIRMMRRRGVTQAVGAATAAIAMTVTVTVFGVVTLNSTPAVSRDPHRPGPDATIGPPDSTTIRSSAVPDDGGRTAPGGGWSESHREPEATASSGPVVHGSFSPGLTSSGTCTLEADSAPTSTGFADRPVTPAPAGRTSRGASEVATGSSLRQIGRPHTYTAPGSTSCPIESLTARPTVPGRGAEERRSQCSTQNGDTTNC